jgi:hypothetical protein
MLEPHSRLSELPTQSGAVAFINQDGHPEEICLAVSRNSFDFCRGPIVGKMSFARVALALEEQSGFLHQFVRTKIGGGHLRNGKAKQLWAGVSPL